MQVYLVYDRPGQLTLYWSLPGEWKIEGKTAGKQTSSTEVECRKIQSQETKWVGSKKTVSD
jgi:hypothetical protein